MKGIRTAIITALVTGLLIIVSTDLLAALTLPNRTFWSLLFNPPAHVWLERAVLMIGLLIFSGLITALQIQRQNAARALAASEQRFRILYEHAPLGYHSLSSTGHVLDVNRTWEVMFGYSRGEVLGRWFGDLLAEEDVSKFRDGFQHFMQEGVVHNAEFRIRRKDGTYTIISINGGLLRSEKPNQMQATVCIVQDISESKRIQHILSRLNRQSKLLLAAAGDGICGLDNEGNIISVNPAAEQMLGYDAGELIWRSFHNTVMHTHADDTSFPLADSPVQQTLTEGMIRSIHNATFWTKGREPLPVDYTSTPLQENGDLLGAVITFQDVTERQIRNNALRESEARYRSLFHDNHSIMLLVDPENGAILDANQAAYDFYGYAPETLTTMTIYDISTRDPEVIRESLIDRYTGSRHVAESNHRLAGGERRDVEIYSGALEIAGQPVVYGIVHDITERKRAEAALHLDEARLEALLRLSQMTDATQEQAADFAIKQAIWLTGSQIGAIAFPNETEAMTIVTHFVANYPDAPAPMQSIEDSAMWAAIVEQHQPAIVNEPQAPSTEDHPHPQITRYMSLPIMAEGQQVVVAFVANKDTDYNDADLRQMQLLLDGMWKLFEQRRAKERDLMLTLEQERLHILSDFIRDAGHEFRHPLSVINTSAYLIERTMGQRDQTQHLQLLRQQAGYINHLLERMLVMLRLENTTPDSYPTCNVNLILQDIEEGMHRDFADHQIALILKLDEAVQDIMADNLQIHRALLEIVTNALNYTPSGGTVILQSTWLGDAVRIAVQDDGEGIEEADLARIFENFYRADKARTERRAGMGLTIANKIIDMHRGQIDVESVPDKGSTFTVTLLHDPLRQLPDSLTDS